jgi:hypothetical protein
MKRNIKLLKQVRDTILKYPDQFYMDDWFSNLNQIEDKPSRCGTAACIAGWSLALSKEAFKKKPSTTQDYFSGCTTSFINREARKALGLNQKQGLRLFLREMWPDRFKFKYSELIEKVWDHKPIKPKQFAKVAASRIDYFIKTGK